MKLSKFDILFPILCLLAGLASQYSGLDIALERLFYDGEQQFWPFKDAWFTSQILHDGARTVLQLVLLSIMAAMVASWIFTPLQNWRRTSLYVFLASITGVVIVGWLKASTHMYTPWDLAVFGGEYPNIRLFDPVHASLPVGYAFPAGHASGGYALLSLYFSARVSESKYQYPLLILALGAGLTLGIAQQLRGAHMLSHDLFTLTICWSAALLLACCMFPLRPSQTRYWPFIGRHSTAH